MSQPPYVLPGAAGAKTLADNLETGALFQFEDGMTYAYRGLLPDGRWALYSLGQNPKALTMADVDTGFPAYPTAEQILQSMVQEKLGLVSSPLESPARIRARGKERTKEEVLDKDKYAEIRMLICRLWDKERPALDDASLNKWLDKRFDWAEIVSDHPRGKPPASSARSWIKKRGRPGNRTWADMEDCRGQGPRAKRVTGRRLAIAVWHAISFWTSRRHPTIVKLWKDVEADTNAYNIGQPLIMHNFLHVWQKPLEPINPADRETFRKLVRTFESRKSDKLRYSDGAAQQRWDGGGAAVEPTRFLEIVQQDETEAPGFFWIDSINRQPLGCATWVIAVDVFTGCVLSWDLSFDAPSTVSWMRSVLKASKYKALPIEYAERFPQLATIGGRISSIVYDNASHLIGRAVEDAHGDVVQDVIYAGEGQPTHKPKVERTHETLRKLFTAALPGAKMQIALAREFNMDPSKEKLLTMEEGQLAMARAVCKYHTEIVGDDGRVPLDRWIEQWNRWGPQHSADQEQFARAIGNVTYDLVLDNGGIVNEGLEYSDRQLTTVLMEAYAATTHHRRRRKKPGFNVKVKWDPTDLSALWVYNPLTEKYVRLPAKRQRYTAGLTLQMHKLILRHQGASSLMSSPEGEAHLMELRRLAELEMQRITPQMQAAEKRARAALIQQPAIRDRMGGDIQLLEVNPSTTGLEVEHDLGLDRKDILDPAVRGKRGSRKNDALADVADADRVGLDAPGALHGIIAGFGDERSLGKDATIASEVQPDVDDDDDIIATFKTY